MESGSNLSGVKIIGWDTSFRKGHLFARDSAESCRFAAVLDVDQRQHSEGLLLGVSEALQETGWKLSELSAIGVGVGPGSFTGIRIGLTTARTLAQMLNLSLVPVSSLEAIELAVRVKSGEGVHAVLTCADACMGEIYCRWSAPERSAHLEIVTKISMLEEQLRTWPGALESGAVAVLPDSWTSHPLLLKIFSQDRWRVVTHAEVCGVSEALSRLVWRDWSAGCAKQALEVFPSYLRASDAELHLRARENALRSPVVAG